MFMTQLAQNKKYLEKLGKVERDIKTLKKFSKTKKPVVSLKGLVKGVPITDKDIKMSRKSLFKHTG